MILYDFECERCGNTIEVFTDSQTNTGTCPLCGGKTKKIISIGRVNCMNEDANWIRSVTEVVDKEGGQHCQEFLKNPTRSNYKKWMKGEGLRPMEPGELPGKPKEPSIKELTDATYKRVREREALKTG